MSDRQVWFVTGATRGLGLEIARAALAAGHAVVATGRDPAALVGALGSSERLLPTTLDVTRPDQIAAAVRTAEERFGRVDVLVNNAGYGQLGVFEATTPDEIRTQFETNVFGLMEVTRAVVRGMRERRSGRVFNISSVAGLRGIFGASIYNASKFAVEGFSQALAAELAPFGVFVTSVSPGYFRTDFLDARSIRYSDDVPADYAPAWNDFRGFHEGRDGQQAGDPRKLAAVLLKLANEARPPVSFVAGTDALEWAKGATDSLRDQVDAWRELSASTDGNW